MALPVLRPDGTLPPGEHHIADLAEVRAAFPATTKRRQALEAALVQLVETVRRLALGTELVIDGSYITGKAEPADIDLALLSTGASEAEILRQLGAEGVDLVALDLFVSTTGPSFARWIQLFSTDRAQQTRGVVILAI
jgi:uncharacterized protein DUF6932